MTSLLIVLYLSYMSNAGAEQLKYVEIPFKTEQDIAYMPRVEPYQISDNKAATIIALTVFAVLTGAISFGHNILNPGEHLSNHPTTASDILTK